MYVAILTLGIVFAVASVVFAVLLHRVSVGVRDLRGEIRRSHDSLNHEMLRLRAETKEEREEREQKEADRRKKAKEEEARRQKEREERAKREAERRELEASRSYSSNDEDDDDDGYECEVGGPSCCGRGQGPYYG